MAEGIRTCTINKLKANISFVGCVVTEGPREGERFAAYSPDGLTAMVECPVVLNLNAPKVGYRHNDPSTWDPPGLMWQDERGEDWSLVWD